MTATANINKGIQIPIIKMSKPMATTISTEQATPNQVTSKEQMDIMTNRKYLTTFDAYEQGL